MPLQRHTNRLLSNAFVPLLLLLTIHLLPTHALDIQDVDPDALDKCATLCISIHTQTMISACRRAHPEITDISDLDTGKCHCTEGESLKEYAQCIARRCPTPVLIKAFNNHEKTCQERNHPLALTREEFVGDAVASVSAASVAATAGGTGKETATATATAASAESTSATAAGAVSTGTRAPTDDAEDLASAAGATSASSPQATASTSPPSKNGLSTSDKVAIGVGLGVGIPTMVIALLTFLTTCKWPAPWLRRKEKPVAEAKLELEQRPSAGAGADTGAGAGSEVWTGQGQGQGQGRGWDYAKPAPMGMASPSAGSLSSSASTLGSVTHAAPMGSWPVEQGQRGGAWQYPYQQSYYYQQL